MMMKFYDFSWKSDETRNPMELKSNDLDLRSGRNPCLKLEKIRTKFGQK